LIHSLFASIRLSRSQYFTSTTGNHLSCGFYLNFLLKACFKSLHAIRLPLIGPTAVTSHAAVNSDACNIQISSQNIRICCEASMQALQCNKVKLLEPASINGLHTHRGEARASITNYTHQMSKCI